jgi:hypothetical protein
MKANELRIGNWISTIYGMEFQVYPMAFKQMPTDEKHNLILDTWKPIPLTEEWLLKFGAKELNAKRGVLKEFVLKTVRIEMSDSGNFYYKNSKLILESAHQLQNLYFALTNKELTFKSE